MSDEEAAIVELRLRLSDSVRRMRRLWREGSLASSILSLGPDLLGSEEGRGHAIRLQYYTRRIALVTSGVLKIRSRRHP
jgi:hypothetical protein